MVLDESLNEMLEEVEASEHVTMEDIVKIADAVRKSDLSNVETVRQLVRQLSRIAKQTISEEKEEEIVNSILNKNIVSSIEALEKQFK